MNHILLYTFVSLFQVFRSSDYKHYYNHVSVLLRFVLQNLLAMEEYVPISSIPENNDTALVIRGGCFAWDKVSKKTTITDGFR